MTLLEEIINHSLQMKPVAASHTMHKVVDANLTTD